MATKTQQLIMKENDLFIPPMTVRDALIKVFDEDWNARKKVQNGDDIDSLTVSVNFNFTVPMKMAKKVYNEVLSGV